MRRKKVLTGPIATAGLLAGFTFGLAALSADREVSCTAYGANQAIEEQPSSYGDFVILDHSDRERDPCRDDDLWHYGDLNGIDGVLFGDCVISWVEGGRTPASEVGVPCESP